MTYLGPPGSTHVPSRASSFTLGGMAFGPWRLDIAAQCLWRSGVCHQLTPLQFAALHLLVTNAGTIVNKQTLLKAVWGDVAVGDNSVERTLSDLRALLDAEDRRQYIQTLPRRGYLFVVPTTAIDPARQTDIEALLDPFRACFEGRLALESLTRDEILRARHIYQHLATQFPERATYHVGLAIACALIYESTRADPNPDREALALAGTEARRACDLSARSAEASATLGVILGRQGDRVGAIVALQRACVLEPDNWLHLCRLAEASWGERRIRAARHALRACPGFSMAHWLVATVLVARRRHDEAEAEIDAAIKSFRAAVASNSVRFLAVALYYLKGLLCLARGATDEALEALDEELALESRGHFYARECCANVWYVKGVIFGRRADLVAARDAFLQALNRVAEHPLALGGIRIIGASGTSGTSGTAGTTCDRNLPSWPTSILGDGQAAAAQPVADPSAAVRPAAVRPVTEPPLAFEREMAKAALLVHAGDVPAAVELLLVALRAAPPGNSGWWISLDPSLRMWEEPDAWEPVLHAVSVRAL